MPMGTHSRYGYVHAPSCFNQFCVLCCPALRESKVDDAMVSTEAVHQAAARVRKVLDSGKLLDGYVGVTCIGR